MKREPYLSVPTLTGDYTDFGSSEPLGIGVRCFTPITEIVGLHRRRVSVEAREMIDVDARSVDYCACVTVAGEMEDDVEGAALVSYQEIDRVTAAIDRLRLAHRGMTKFQSFEARFESPDGLHIVVFSQPDHTLAASVSAGSVTAFIQPVSRLEELKNALVASKDYIARNRIDAS